LVPALDPGEDLALDSTVVQEFANVYNGGTLMQMVIETTVDDGAPVTETLSFSYDVSGKPMNVIYNGTAYFYAVNLQGDVIAILDENGNCVVEYSYDAWGNITKMGGTNETLADANPLRYRGYYYDQETGLYYLQSRYYNPQWGRFINADAVIS
jgi:RHS repeat-associated protein